MSVPQDHHPLPALSEIDPAALETWATERGLPTYRGRQLRAALTRGALQDIHDLSEFSLPLRQELAASFRTRTVRLRIHLRSKLDHSEKVLFELGDGTTVETVLIRSRGSTRRERYTVCVSSQVGCPAGCTFCATGLGGFSRNLSGPEMSDQVMYFAHALATEGKRVSNVVFMGMGEPLLNTKNVRGAIERLTDPTGFDLAERAITVSTVGIVPQLRAYADWAGQVNLAISLHAPNNTLRSQLVPYNRHFPIADLMDCVSEYVVRTRRRVSFEYVLLKGVNDSPALARELGELIKPFGGLAHVNLIPWNPFREGRFVRSEGPDAEAFAAIVRRARISTTIRYSKGLDISAACGQLRERASEDMAAQENGGPIGSPLLSGQSLD